MSWRLVGIYYSSCEKHGITNASNVIIHFQFLRPVLAAPGKRYKAKSETAPFIRALMITFLHALLAIPAYLDQ